jgi:hypothetical protein
MIFCGAGDERFWTPYRYLKPWVPPLPMAFILAPWRWRWRRRERLRRVSEPRSLLLCPKTMGAGGRWEGRRPIHSWVVPELPVSTSRGRATGGALSSRRQGGVYDIIAGRHREEEAARSIPCRAAEVRHFQDSCVFFGWELRDWVVGMVTSFGY